MIMVFMGRIVGNLLFANYGILFIYGDRDILFIIEMNF